jgi:hypothetical protein
VNTYKATAKGGANGKRENGRKGQAVTAPSGFRDVVARIRENEADNLDAWAEAHGKYVACQASERSLTVSEWARRAESETGYKANTIRRYVSAVDWANDPKRRKNLHTTWKTMGDVLEAKNPRKKTAPKKKNAKAFTMVTLTRSQVIAKLTPTLGKALAIQAADNLGL